MPDFSVICCVSDPGLYDRVLLDSVYQARGGHDVELIPILNQDHRYSAAQAYNTGIAAASCDRLVLAHQDVRLLGADWFDRLAARLADLPPDWAVLGAAGIGLRHGSRDIGPWGGALGAASVVVGEVWDSDQAATPYWLGEREWEPIHAADECLMVLDRRRGLQFDHRLDGFHFYGVELCLQARAAGHGVYGARLPLVHYAQHSSSMAGEHRYWAYLRQVHAQWVPRFPECLATHMHWVGPLIISYMGVALEAEHGSEPLRVRALGIGRVETQ